MLLLSLAILLLVGYVLLRIYVVNGPKSPPEHLPDNLANKIIVVTGASNGIGRFTATELYKKQARVILACRNEEKTRNMMREILDECKNVKNCGSLEFVKLSLDDLESVRDCAMEILGKVDHIDILINNAGGLSNSIRYPTKFKHVEEMVFTNAIAHHLLIELLWENMETNPNGSRIVIVASNAHQFVNENDFYQKSSNSYSMTPFVKQPRSNFLPALLSMFEVNKQYGLSKLCNIYQTFYLHEQRIKNNPNSKVTINCCHPGAIRTSLTREMPLLARLALSIVELLFFKNIEQGSQNTIHLACSTTVNGISGQYFQDCHIDKPSSIAFNKQLMNEFIALTNETIKPYLSK